jgi:type IV secretory pathway TraG/TraD family ATPase VirD4
VAIPSWVTFAAPSIFGGLLVFGRKGSGKTSLLLRMLEDAIRFRADDPEQKPAICVLDQKGDIAEFIVAKAKEHGREADVTRLGVGTEAKWNPFGELGPASTALECRQVGFFMRCAMTAGTSASMEAAFWQDNADNLIFRSVHLLALAGEPVGFGAVYQLITSANAGDGALGELFTRAEYVMNLRETQGADVRDQRQELRDTDRYFEEDFGKLDPKIRTTVISVVSNFNQKFMTAQYARSFGCPAETPGHFAGFRDLIARGRIFILDVRANEHGTVANALGVLVKLYYQAAVKTRDRYPGDKFQRTTMYVMDEAQACITPSSANTEGDDKYLEMSRSFKAIDVYATQQYSSFTAAVGREMAQRIIGSFNNLVVYRHNDPALTEYLQKLAGQSDREERSVSVSESSSAAERNLLAAEGETERDKQVSRSVSVQRRERQVVETAIFKEMSTFEALGFFDSPRGLAITHFFTKPHFVDPRTPHLGVLEKIEASR